jgi:HK97 family phage major capsid protein
MIKYNGTIHDMVREIEESIRDNKDREETLRSRIQHILDRAEARGEKSLDAETDKRCEAMFSDIEELRSARKRMNAKLARAREVAAEENEADARLNERVENPVIAARRNSGSGEWLRIGEPVSRNGVELYGASVARDDSPSWVRSNDGRNAIVERGQSFNDHAVVRDVMGRESERDRAIVGQHGDFGHMVRAMTTSGASAIVPTIWSSSIIDKARNASVMYQAGAQMVPMDAKTVQIGRLTGDPAPAFKTEGSPVTPGDMTFDYVQLVATSLSALVVVSLEFVQDAPNASYIIENALGKAMALEIDRNAMFGQIVTAGNNEGINLPSPAPKGILKNLLDNASGNVLGGATNGTAQTAATPWTEMLAVVYKPLRSNERVSAIVSNVALRQQYDGMVDTMYNPIRMPDTIAKLPWLQTNAIPSFTAGTMASRATDVFAGDFSQVLIGQRLGLEVRVLTERYAENGQIGLLAYWRGDIQVARPAALACYRYIQGAA